MWAVLSLALAGLLEALVKIFGKLFVDTVVRLTLFAAFAVFCVLAVKTYLSTAFALVDMLNVAMPPVVSGVFGWVFPPNAEACFVAISSTHLLKFTTQLYFSLLNTKFKALISRS